MGIFRGGAGHGPPSGDGLREGSGYRSEGLMEASGARRHQQASRRHGNYRGRGALADAETLRAGFLEILGEGYKFSWRAEDGLFSFSMS